MLDKTEILIVIFALLAAFYLVISFGAKNNKKTESHVYNLGKPKTVTLKHLIKTMEIIYGKNFKKKYIAKQPGDVLNTAANLIIEKKKFKLKFSYNLERGLKNFYFWFKKNKNY